MEAKHLEKLNYLVDILEEIEDKPEKLTLEQIKKKNPCKYPLFSQHCLGGKSELVRSHPPNVLKLTQEGCRKLSEWRDRLVILTAQEKQHESNTLVALGTSAVAISAGLGFLLQNKILTAENELSLGIIGVVLIFLIIFIIIKAYGLIGKHNHTT